jgi:hypothetical protein
MLAEREVGRAIRQQAAAEQHQVDKLKRAVV